MEEITINLREDIMIIEVAEVLRSYILGGDYNRGNDNRNNRPSYD